MCRFDTLLYIFTNICLTIDQTTDLKNPLQDVDQDSSKETEASFHIWILYFPICLSYITGVRTILDVFARLNVLIKDWKTPEGQKDFSLQALNGGHKHVLRSLHSSSDRTLHWVPDQVRVSNIFRQDETFSTTWNHYV